MALPSLQARCFLTIAQRLLANSGGETLGRISLVKKSCFATQQAKVIHSRNFAVSSSRANDSTTVDQKQTRKNGNTGHDKQKKWWSMSFETKVFSSILFGLVSYFATTYLDKRHARKEIQLELITKQIRDLYGPLYGNRLVEDASFKGVVGEHKHLRDYLKRAEEEKNAEMIHKWRSFVWNVLYPLDKEAQQLICENAHLVVNHEFPGEFKLFLTHFARLQFVMEEWKGKDGNLEPPKAYRAVDFLERTNASGQAGLSQLFEHVESRCEELRATQQQLVVELSSAEHDHILTGLFKKFR